MTNQLAVRDDMKLTEVAAAFVKSGYFQDSRDVSQAIVKILAGREFGYGPFASMTGIYIIQGRPSMSANLMASAVKNSGRYDYRVRQMDDKACAIEYFQRVDGKWESIGTSTFTIEDARKAGTKNTDKYPRNMLFARAMSNGVRWFCPDTFSTSVYTPEELGAEVAEDGSVIDVESYTPQPARQEETILAELGYDKPKSNGKKTSRPLQPATLKEMLETKADTKHKGKSASDDQRKLLVILMDNICQGDDDKRHTIQQYLFGSSSLVGVDNQMVLAALDWLNPAQDDGGLYTPDPMAVKEAEAVYTAALVAEGQQELI